MKHEHSNFFEVLLNGVFHKPYVNEIKAQFTLYSLILEVAQTTNDIILH